MLCMKEIIINKWQQLKIRTIIINKPVTKSLLMVAILSSRCGLVQMNLFILTSEKYKIVLISSVSWTYKFTCRAAWSWAETVFST